MIVFWLLIESIVEGLQMSKAQLGIAKIGDTSALDPDTWSQDVRTLRSVRDQNSERLQAAREKWYLAQVTSMESRGALLPADVQGYANELAKSVRAGLTRAAERGESEFILHIFSPVETQGW